MRVGRAIFLKEALVAARTMSYKGLVRKASSRNITKALPFVAGGVAIGGAVWLIARNWSAISEFVQDWLPSQDEEQGETSASQNKPYPVEHTSKKHSKSHAMFKDVQKISQV